MVAAVGFLLATGCRTLEPAPVPLAADDPRPPILLESLAARSASLQALRGMARLAVDGPEGSIRSKQALVAERVARLRIEILGFLNQAQALLVTDGEFFEFFRVQDRYLERGRVWPDLLHRVAGIDLTPSEAVEVLLGAPATPETWSPVGAGWIPDRRIHVLFTDPDGAPRQILEFDVGGPLRRVERLAADGTVLWVARYDDYKTVSGVHFAHAIEIDFPPTEVHARFSLRDVELNPELPADTFVLHLPSELSNRRGEGT